MRSQAFDLHQSVPTLLRRLIEAFAKISSDDADWSGASFRKPLPIYPHRRNGEAGHLRLNAKMVGRTLAKFIARNLGVSSESKKVISMCLLAISFAPSAAYASPHYFRCAVIVRNELNQFEVIIDAERESGSATQLRADGSAFMSSVGQPTFFPSEVDFLLPTGMADLVLQVAVDRNNLNFYYVPRIGIVAGKTDVGKCVEFRAPSRRF